MAGKKQTSTSQIGDVNVTLTGDEELNKTFEKLKASQQRSILISVFRKASKSLIVSMKSGIAANLQDKGRRNLLDSIGLEPIKNKIAVAVGARTKGGYKGYIARIFSHGTVERKTKKGWLRGSISANNFFSEAVNSQEDAVYEAINTHFEATIEKFFYKQAEKANKMIK